MRYIRRLEATGLTDAAVIGRKAAVLADLAAAGFRVPGGFVIEAGARDEDVTDDVRVALERLGEGPVAVRSSGIAEDLEGRSFAGQYESVLDVRGLDAVLDAVRACWASADADRVAVYRGGGGENAMGVLVQRMVPADAAGVAFSANPVTGDTTSVLVSAVTGLADKLVSGERTADEWRVRDDRPELVASAAGDTGTPEETAPRAIDLAQAAEIAALVRAVAEHYGTPQDIEWAYAGSELYLLQARPITTLPIPIPIEQPEYFSVRDVNAAKPWTRLQTSLFLPVFSDAAPHVFRFTTGATPYASSIGGWTYLTSPPIDAGEQLRRLERIAQRLDGDEPRALVERWNAEWKPAFRDRIAKLRETEPAGLDDAGLQAYLTELIVHFGRLHDVYFRLTGAAIVLLAELGVVAQELLGWGPEQTLRLRGGLRGDHVAATAGLSELARMGESDPGFAAAFESYTKAYGHRTVGFDLTQPTLAEQPGVLRNLVRQQAEAPLDLDRERAALQEKRDAVLAEAEITDPEAKKRFEDALAGSDLGTPVRDEKVFYAVSLWALLRYALLELGGRLAAADLVDRADDVWHLHVNTALDALDRGAPLREEVRLGRGRLAWAQANPGPPFYGPPPAGFDDTGLPEPSAGARHVMELAQWSMSLRGGPAKDQDLTDDVRGLAASAGSYTGPARVIRDVTDFGKLRRGDVLVCPETTAQWAVLFPSVGALVCDRGSVLSHPAIISREYGVPAVLATGNATAVFTDGQLLTVDGTTGVVRLAELPEGIPA